jgi:arylsulfatase A-like enzyme
VPKPNVLVILLDQLTRRALSLYGNAYVQTPHIDALASGGMRFDRAYCASPVCGPSRCSLLTGLMPHETGVEVNGPEMPVDIPNLGDVFRAGGYLAAYAGKWHAGERRGFDFLGPEYSQGVDPRFGTETDPVWVDQAIGFIKEKHTQPFLLVTSLHNPHDICYWIMDQGQLTPEPGLDDLPPLPPNFVRDQNEPEFITTCRARTHYGNEANWTVDWDETDWQKYLFGYYRLVERVDEQVGRVLLALDDAGLTDETLVLLTSDHGEGVAEHEWVVKLMLYESVVGVPLIVRLPGVIDCSVNKHALIAGVDLLPTLCDFAQIDCPSVTGKSFVPCVMNTDLLGRDYVVSHLATDTQRLEMQGRMVRSEWFKYVVFSEGDRPELLFDLRVDPGETVNLSCGSKYQNVLTQHQALLKAWCRETKDPFLTDV